MDARSEILARLANSLADQPQPDEIPREYRRSSSRSHDEIIERLIDRLEDYRATVYRETLATLPQRIETLLSADTGENQQNKRCVVASGIDDSWLPDRDFLVDSVEQPLSIEDLDELDAVLTGSTVAAADTGTIFLSAQPDEGRRAITLIPDHHICIVNANSVVDLVPEALEKIEPTQPITMISGPSATSDIELERVEGVHGPRRLDVVITFS